MIKHFNADGTEKQQWAEGLHAEVIPGQPSIGRVYGSNAMLAQLELQEGEQLGQEFQAGDQPEAAKTLQPILSADDKTRVQNVIDALKNAATTLQQAADIQATQGTAPQQ